MNRFRKKMTRGCALLLAVVMLLFTPATDYLSAGQDITGKIESEAFVAGVAAYEIIKYLLIAAASLAGAYGLSNVQWGNLVNEFLDSINDTALSINAFAQIIIKEGETISQWSGSAFYFPNGLGGDPNNPDPDKKPKISLAKKLTIAWLLFLNSKNLTSSSRQPDATVADVTEYVPEAVFSDDFKIKFSHFDLIDFYESSSDEFRSYITNSSNISYLNNFFYGDRYHMVGFTELTINIPMVEALFSKLGVLQTYPYWYMMDDIVLFSATPFYYHNGLAKSDSSVVGYSFLSAYLYGSLSKLNIGNGHYSLRDGMLYMNFEMPGAVMASEYTMHYVLAYDQVSSLFNPEKLSMYNDISSGKVGFYYPDYGVLSSSSFLVYYFRDFPQRMKISSVSSNSSSFAYNNFPSLFSFVLPFYASLLDCQRAMDPLNAPAPGLYDPTKSTENIPYDEEGNFSLEFDDLKQSMEQLNQKVDAATEADTALDNQLKQDLMDYVDSLTQGKTEPEVPPETDPAPTETAPPETDPTPTEAPPETDPSTDPTPDDLKPENWKIPLEFKNKFPFSIPWDVYGALTVLQATETPPIWEVPFVVKNDYIKIEEKIVLDLTKPEYTNLIKIIRAFFLLLYIVSLVMVTRYLIKG